MVRYLDARGESMRPEELIPLDVATRELSHYLGDGLSDANARRLEHDIFVAVQLCGLLQSIGFDPEACRRSDDRTSSPTYPAWYSHRLNRPLPIKEPLAAGSPL